MLLDDVGYHVLYATGLEQIKYAHLSSSGVAGDYDVDGTVDAAEFTVWRDELGSA